MRACQIAVSPCSNPEMNLDEVLSAYSSLGYSKFEVFTSWASSAVDYHRSPDVYLEKGCRFDMNFTSMHLPPVSAECPEATLQEAYTAAQFAEAIGVEVVLYKASDRSTYIEAAEPFLNVVENLSVIPVIQNHYGTPLSTLDDVKEVFEAIGDPRLYSLLEVGHFHSAGVTWREAAEYLGDSIALVHIKDQIGQQSVPFGKGEIDLPGLFNYLDDRDYRGRYVVEMEVTDDENTLYYLEQARHYVMEFCEEM
ncbi:MAG: sugar phosphate isomerase/epimerase family protein [Candidatus Brocadiia bacterium]